MSIRVNPHLKHSPHAIQDTHDFILLLNMYKHFKNLISGTQLFLKAFLAGGVFSTYKIILGIHTYIFHNRECDFFCNIFFGGTTLGWGGHVPSVPPGIYAHGSRCVCVCVCTLDGLNAEYKFRVCHVTFSSTIHSKKKKKRVSFNPYKDIYYCQPLKL